MRLLCTTLAVALLAYSLIDAQSFSSCSFEGPNATLYCHATCEEPWKVGTIYASSMKSCTDGKISTEVFPVAKLYWVCYGRVAIIYWFQNKNITSEYLNSLRIIDYIEIPATENAAEKVTVNGSYYAAVGRATKEGLGWEFTQWSSYDDKGCRMSMFSFCRCLLSSSSWLALFILEKIFPRQCGYKLNCLRTVGVELPDIWSFLTNILQVYITIHLDIHYQTPQELAFLVVLTDRISFPAPLN